MAGVCKRNPEAVNTGKSGKRKQYRAYRFRLYPDARQMDQMNRTFGCCRFIYNQMLADKIAYYKEKHAMLRTTPAQYKQEHQWLKEVDSLALANEQLHLEAAYRNFFSNGKTGHPKFHAKHHCRDSFTTNMVNGNIGLSGTRLKLPKMEPVRIVVHRAVPEEGRLKSVTVTREPSGKYYASLLYEVDACENQTAACLRADHVLGIDFAMDGLGVLSDGTHLAYPMFYRKAEEKLKKEQRRLSRCVKGSHNYDRQRRKLARAYEKVRNQRRDYREKLSHHLAQVYDAVAVEDLDMKGMSRSLHFGKSVMDNANGQFRRKVEEKLGRKGKAFVKVGRYYPSSKKCSCCGKVKESLPLSERTYRCECGNVMDRDWNAAVNIREEGIRILGISA